MEKQKVVEALPQVMGHLLTLEQQKSDCDLLVDALLETYGFTKEESKALVVVAKAKISWKINKIEKATDILSEMIGIAQETGSDQ